MTERTASPSIWAAASTAAGWWTSYRRIALPLARPAAAAVSIFAFAWTWNNFLWPFLAVNALQMASARSR